MHKLFWIILLAIMACIAAVQDCNLSLGFFACGLLLGLTE